MSRVERAEAQMEKQTGQERKQEQQKQMNKKNYWICLEYNYYQKELLKNI